MFSFSSFASIVNQVKTKLGLLNIGTPTVTTSPVPIITDISGTVILTGYNSNIPVYFRNYRLYYNSTMISDTFTMLKKLSNPVTNYNGSSYFFGGFTCDLSNNYYFATENTIAGSIRILNDTYPDSAMYATKTSNTFGVYARALKHFNGRIYYGGTFQTAGILYVQAGLTTGISTTTGTAPTNFSTDVSASPSITQFIQVVCFDNTGNMYFSRETFDGNVYKADVSLNVTTYITGLPTSDRIWKMDYDGLNTIYCLMSNIYNVYTVDVSNQTSALYYNWDNTTSFSWKEIYGSSLAIDASKNIYLSLGATGSGNTSTTVARILNITNPSSPTETITQQTMYTYIVNSINSNFSNSNHAIMAFNSKRNCLGVLLVSNGTDVSVSEFNLSDMRFTNVIYNSAGTNSTQIIDTTSNRLTTSFNVTVKDVVTVLSGATPLRSTYNGFKVVYFKDVGNSSVEVNNPTSLPINIAVVGGGGAGGFATSGNTPYGCDWVAAGGGGGGQVKTIRVTDLSSDNVTISVGAGGNVDFSYNVNGQSSSVTFTSNTIYNLTSFGGGGGGSPGLISADSSANSGGTGGGTGSLSVTKLSGNCGVGYYRGGFAGLRDSGGGGGCGGSGFGRGGYSGRNFGVDAYYNFTIAYSFDNSAIYIQQAYAGPNLYTGNGFGTSTTPYTDISSAGSADGGPGIQLTISGNVMPGINPDWYFGAGGGGGGGVYTSSRACGNGGKGGGGAGGVDSGFSYNYNGSLDFCFNSIAATDVSFCINLSGGTFSTTYLTSLFNELNPSNTLIGNPYTKFGRFNRNRMGCNGMPNTGSGGGGVGVRRGNGGNPIKSGNGGSGVVIITF